MLVKSGTYLGDGGTSHAITGVGFAPTALFIKRPSTTAQFMLAIEVAGTTHTKRGNVGEAWDATGTLTLDADGFTLTATNAEINENNQTYAYLAMSADAADCATFTYTGNGAGDRSVGAISFTPDCAFVMPANTAAFHWRTDQVDVAHSQQFAQVLQDGRIEAFEATGIQVGGDFNANTVAYFVLCIKKASTKFSTVEYSGDGADNRDIAHSLGAVPGFALIQQQTDQSSREAVVRFASQVGDLSMDYNAAETTNKIQAMDATNVQVGTDVNVNENTKVYTLATWGGAPAAAGATTRHLMLLGVGT